MAMTLLCFLSKYLSNFEMSHIWQFGILNLSKSEADNFENMNVELLNLVEKVICCRCIRKHVYVGKGLWQSLIENVHFSTVDFMINAFPHTTNLQQTTLKTYGQKC